MTTTLPQVHLAYRIDGFERRCDGRVIRAAMDQAGWTIHSLARRTAELDPSGSGVNWRTIGFLVSQGASGRDTCTERTANLIAAALGVPLDDLFVARTSPIVQAPTSAQRRESADAP